MGLTKIASVAVYFAQGEDMISCKLMEEAELPQVGSVVELAHTCPATPEGTERGDEKTYKVVANTMTSRASDHNPVVTILEQP